MKEYVEAVYQLAEKEEELKAVDCVNEALECQRARVDLVRLEDMVSTYEAWVDDKVDDEFLLYSLRQSLAEVSARSDLATSRINVKKK
jgi:hypothetical protein